MSESYSISNDNEGLSNWLAYHLGLQMMWTQISTNMKKVEEKKSKMHIITEPQEAFKNTFKYFFEERIWKLA